MKLNEVLADDLLIQDVTADEVREAISDANANSAPGPSQQSNKVVRWAWNADPDTIIRLYRWWVRLGYHPRIFRRAVAVALRKPRKPDYSKVETISIQTDNTSGMLGERN